MDVRDCSIGECVPPHGVAVASHRDSLAASMQLDGWAGRPLLGWYDAASGAVFLLTGSHRYAAAKAAGLEEVPVALVDVAEGRLGAHGEELHLDGERLVDFCGDALLDMLREEDPAAYLLLTVDCRL